MRDRDPDGANSYYTGQGNAQTAHHVSAHGAQTYNNIDGDLHRDPAEGPAAIDSDHVAFYRYGVLDRDPNEGPAQYQSDGIVQYAGAAPTDPRILERHGVCRDDEGHYRLTGVKNGQTANLSTLDTIDGQVEILPWAR